MLPAQDSALAAGATQFGAESLAHNEHLLVVNMRRDDYAALKLKAAQRRKSPVEFAGMLLEAIVSANIFDAVLDDRK